MKREIKFRAWDKYFKKFSENALEYPVNDIEYLTDYEWSQYTGLKDKNDKEIYESDIICFTIFDCFDNDTQYKGEVFWNGETAEFAVSSDKNNCWNLGWIINQDVEIEVIGNIYEREEV